MSTLNAFCFENEKKIVVAWETESEVNASHFEIEQSINGIDWYNLGQVQAAGNSSTTKKYEFIKMIQEILIQVISD